GHLVGRDTGCLEGGGELVDRVGQLGGGGTAGGERLELVEDGGELGRGDALEAVEGLAQRVDERLDLRGREAERGERVGDLVGGGGRGHGAGGGVALVGGGDLRGLR